MAYGKDLNNKCGTHHEKCGVCGTHHEICGVCGTHHEISLAANVLKHQSIASDPLNFVISCGPFFSIHGNKKK